MHYSRLLLGLHLSPVFWADYSQILKKTLLGLTLLSLPDSGWHTSVDRYELHIR